MGTLFLISYVLLWVLVLALTAAVFALMKIAPKQAYETESKTKDVLPGPEIGKRIPEFQAFDAMANEAWSLQRLAGRPSFLFFFHPHCSGCHEMIPVVNQFVQIDSGANAVVLSRAGRAENIDYIEDRKLQLPVLVDKGGEIALSMKVNHTPYVVLLDGNGVVVNKFGLLGTTAEDLANLVKPYHQQSA